MENLMRIEKLPAMEWRGEKSGKDEIMICQFNEVNCNSGNFSWVYFR